MMKNPTLNGQDVISPSQTLVLVDAYLPELNESERREAFRRLERVISGLTFDVSYQRSGGGE